MTAFGIDDPWRRRRSLKFFFIGKSDLLVVGLARTVRLSGPAVGTSGRRILADFATVHSIQEILDARQPETSADDVVKMWVEFVNLGIFHHGRHELEDSSTEMAEFIDRFDNRLTSLHCLDAVTIAELLAPIGYLDSASGELRQLLTGNQPPAPAVAAVFSPTFASYTTSQFSLKLVRRGGGILLCAAPVGGGVSRDRTATDVHRRLESRLAEHWLALAKSGVAARAHGESGAGAFVADEAEAPMAIADATTLGSFAQPRSLLELICKFSAGGEMSGGCYRRIAPTAGGLGSPAVFCVVADQSGEGECAVSCWDELSGRLLPVRRHPRAEFDALGLGMDDGVILIFVGARSRLLAKYGPLAETLVYVDAGVALNHALLCAHAYDADAELLDRSDLNRIRGLLGLSQDESAVPITGACRISRSDSNEEVDLAHRGRDATARMMSRRSVRALTPSVIDYSLVQQVEERSWASPAVAQMMRLKTPLSYLRICKADEDVYIVVQIFLSDTGIVRKDCGTVSSFEVTNWFKQRELAEAAVIYAVPVLHGIDNPSGATSLLVAAGMLLSELWLQAEREGLVGTMAGRVDIARFRRFQDYSHAVALCLSGSLGDPDAPLRS